MNVNLRVKNLKSFSKTKGFSLVEVIVTIGVIVLLISLIVPAVFAAREAARRVHCANNLHQLGVALTSYSSSFGNFPNDSNGNGYSHLVLLLPYLEKPSLFSSINFQLSPYERGINHANNTSFSTRVGEFLCPSENIPFPHFGGGTSYAGNRGVNLRDGRDNGTFNGGIRPPTKYGDFHDGTSSTAAMSEWVIGPGAPTLRDPRGSIFNTHDILRGPHLLVAFEEECTSINEKLSKIALNHKGNDWMLGGYAHTAYNHNLSINGHSCINEGFVQEGVYSAGSRHPMGAHTLFVDGHVIFLSSTSSIKFWRAIGTRDGGEVIDNKP